MKSLAVLLTVVFVTLKLIGYIHWSWVWVVSPIWIWLAISVLLVLVIAVCAGIVSAMKD